MTALLLSLVCVSQLQVEHPLRPEEQELNAVLSESRSKARSWHYSWIGIYGANVAAQGTVAGVTDGDQRTTRLFGLVPPAAGLLYSVFQPIGSLKAVSERKLIDQLYPDDDGSRIAAKKRLVRELAANERAQRGWFPRVAGIVLNLAAAGAIWGLTGELENAAIQLGAGIALNELKLQTSPRTLTSYVRQPEALPP
ncbi:MAG: hypothetical protein ACFB9M_03715 [Myxococcota bacterium]